MTTNTKKTTKTKGAAPNGKERFLLERNFDAPPQDVWDLWTTKDGIESWWGPGGFKVTVHSIDLRVGGQLVYAMTATEPPQIEFMKRAGMPISTITKMTYTEVVPIERLAYFTLVDFVPGVTAYDVGTVIDIEASENGTRMVLTLDAMHDNVWTERAVAGWESEIEKLAKLIEARR